MNRGVIYTGIALMLGVTAILMGSYYRKIGNIWPAFSPAPYDIVSLLGKSTSSPPYIEPQQVVPAQPSPLAVPRGFSVSVYAKDLGGPRVLLTDPNGTLVASLTSQGSIVALPDENTDGVADQVITILSGLRKPHGLAFSCNGAAELCHLYVAEENAVSVYEYDPPTREAVARKKLFDLPTGGLHFTRSLQMLSDGRLLVSIGSTCQACQEDDARRGTVQVWDGKTLKPYVTGLRNAVFLAERPGTDEIWVTEMGRDLLGDDLPPDELNVLEEGKRYGWPTCYGKNVHDTVYDKNTYIRNPCMEPFETPSRVDLQAHAAPLGLAFVPADAGWPAAWVGDAIVANHGSWNRSIPVGYNLVRVKLDANGASQGVEDFITGWLTPKGALGRPTGLWFDRDGTLYVGDDKAGVVYRVRY